jgi:DNA replication and repair protein RecF
LTRFVGATSFNILEGEPSLRRRFFDWALFHVERDARQLWARVARLQSQRNAWLRSGGGGIAVWDAPYVEQLRALWDRRLRYLKDLDFAFRRLTAKHLAVGELGLQWRWLGEGRDLFEILQAHRSSDRARGFTHLSASRGDVSFVQDGLDWQGSRGENKIAGILLQLAVHSVMAATTGQKPIVLLDDPYSEVSAGGVAPLLSAWMAVSDQMIVTCLGNAGGGALRAHPGTVFHVERGILSRSRPVDGDS